MSDLSSLLIGYLCKKFFFIILRPRELVYHIKKSEIVFEIVELEILFSVHASGGVRRIFLYGRTRHCMYTLGK